MVVEGGNNSTGLKVEPQGFRDLRRSPLWKSGYLVDGVLRRLIFVLASVLARSKVLCSEASFNDPIGRFLRNRR